MQHSSVTQLRAPCRTSSADYCTSSARPRLPSQLRSFAAQRPQLRVRSARLAAHGLEVRRCSVLVFRQLCHMPQPRGCHAQLRLNFWCPACSTSERAACGTSGYSHASPLGSLFSTALKYLHTNHTFEPPILICIAPRAGSRLPKRTQLLQ